MARYLLKVQTFAANPNSHLPPLSLHSLSLRSTPAPSPLKNPSPITYQIIDRSQTQMESDDDYQSFSPEKEPSPPVHRRLKRLKKSAQVSDTSSAEPIQEDLSPSALDPFKSTALESSELLDSEAKRDMGFDDVEDELVSEMPNPIAEMEEQARSGSPSEGSQVGNESNPGTKGLISGGNAKETKKSLNFDDSGDEFDGKMTSQAALVDENNGDLKREKSEKKRLSKDNSDEKRNKRAKSSAGEAKPKASSRRREEKERKIHLQQLHAESQRLLRETRDAAFKPVPIVRKPISSVLEKIRQRKAELLNRTVSLGTNSTSKDSETNHLSEEVSPKEVELSDSAEGTMKKTSECYPAGDSNPDASNAEESKEGTTQPSHESIPSQAVSDELLTNEFRAPVNDTQDLFSDTQASEEKDDTSSDHDNSHLEEVLAPSLLAMDLKFDSAPCDDISSDEEDNDDKENTDPDRAAVDHSSPRGDPVKAFVDDEAVEEDDSDNDLLRFQENDDDEGNEDFEDLKDLIATECEEKPSDKDRRNELHQKWLEQQDAAGTDNLLHRLKCGSKLKETSLLGDEEEDSDLDKYEEESDDEGGEDPAKTSLVRINSRKAKQMIPQMFSDKTDGYLSSDGEETEIRLVKQRILGKTVDKGPLLAPADDDRASEVFGLIKKLNVVPEVKKKAKTSFFEKTLLVANNSSFSKSSFLGRETSNSLPSSHKQGTSKVRSYIFGRDDSNSRSSLPISEDSLDVQQNLQENRTVKTVVHKFSGSQSKTSTQSTRSGTETVTGVSLFEMLKRSSEDTNACKQDKIVGLSQTLIASFRVPKKPINIQGRTL